MNMGVKSDINYFDLDYYRVNTLENDIISTVNKYTGKITGREVLMALLMARDFIYEQLIKAGLGGESPTPNR